MIIQQRPNLLTIQLQYIHNTQYEGWNLDV
jgi:hypothetical protein